MKLKGMSLIVPVADYRPILAPEARFQFVSPYVATPGWTRIKGFGVAIERKLRDTWRGEETVYFRCRGAISLPRRLPDTGFRVGAGVTKSCARAYFDDGPTVRLDLSVFTNPR